MKFFDQIVADLETRLRQAGDVNAAMRLRAEATELEREAARLGDLAGAKADELCGTEARS